MQQRSRLPIGEDMRFQERAWLAVRVGWVLLAAVILLALLGIFSGGIMSAAKAERDGTALSVDYERFQRRSTQTHFRLHVPKQTEDEIWLRFGRAFQDTYEIEAVQPQPLRSHISSTGISLFFDADDQDDLNIVVRVRPRRFGMVNIEIARQPGLLQMPVLIYP